MPITPHRLERIRTVLSRRQPDLTLVLNNIHDPHNVSAILRSCDAFGVLKVHLLYTSEAFPLLGKRSSASARKWVGLERHTSPAEMVRTLDAQGHHLIAASFDPTTRPLPEWDLTRPTAVILGNEHRGVDQQLTTLVPDHLYIPMQGMVQSFNVSVAAALILYEAWRQRSAKGMYDSSALAGEELERLIREWCEK